MKEYESLKRFRKLIKNETNFQSFTLLNLSKKSFLILFLTFFTVFLEVVSIGSIVPVVLFFWENN